MIARVETPLIRYSRWALVLTVASIPLYVFRFKAVVVPTTPLEILILLTVALYVVGRWREHSWRPVRTGLEIPTAVLLLAGLISIVVSPDHIGAIGFYRAYFIEPVLLFYVAVALLRKPADFRMLITGFAIGTSVFAILNLGAWVIALANHKDIDLGNAPEALYTSPNSVAIFLEPAVALAAGFVLYTDNRRDRVAALVWLACVLASLIATLSRAGLLTLAILVLVAVITLPQARLKLALLGGGMVAGIVLLQIPFVTRRLYRQFDPSYPYNTFEGRLQIWSDTLHMLRDHPIFGAGLRAYAIVMKPYVTTPTRLPELYPHNIYLAMWVELGLLGLVAFVTLLGLLLWRGWSSYAKAQGLARPLLWGTSAAFVTVAVHGIFDTPYFNNDISVEFWILAALEIAAIAVLLPESTRKEVFQR